MTQVEEQIVQMLRRIIRSIDLHSRSLSRDFKLTWPQLAALQELQRLGKTPLGRLAEEMYVGPPTVTGIVDRLEREGLAQRVREGDDRRKVLVTLTDEAHKLLAQKPSLLNEPLRERLVELSERQQKQMLVTLERLADMMEPHAEENGHGDTTPG